MPDATAVELVARLRAAGCVFAEEEAALLLAEARDDGHLERLVARRVAGEPLEHVVGWASFCGLRIVVERGVFVPRRRTELLAREAARRCRPGGVVVDLCCGAGAIGAAIASAVAGIELHAADIDAAAVRCAARNLARWGGRVHRGDLFDALPAARRGRIDVLVANTPYVPSAEVDTLPREARVHEPLVALDGGADGLDVQRRVAAAAGEWLAPGGHVLVEVTAEQSAAAADLFRIHGMQVRAVADEETGAVVVVATRPRWDAS